MILEAYLDANYVGSTNNRRSTSDIALVLEEI